ncbi:putative beta-mannanase [Phaeomoniella chlamydospora]|uniref:Putative beta-mannanase n=1 Tax=Phaeomoniella chlamydospora TaxID=158046 RepID=A0A0G2EW78_PHACM|nr:putative beta-mannanase [Phaeomoniella chlamydospora]
MLYSLTIILALCTILSFAFNTWAGANLFYAAGLNTTQQDTLFTSLQAANIKVLREWLDGQTSTQKGTTFTSFPSLEPDKIGNFDDTVLNLLDNVMVNTSSYGIKLLVSMYIYNSLEAGGVYGKAYGTEKIYTDSATISAFETRLWHILLSRESE